MHDAYQLRYSGMVIQHYKTQHL